MLAAGKHKDDLFYASQMMMSNKAEIIVLKKLYYSGHVSKVYFMTSLLRLPHNQSCIIFKPCAWFTEIVFVKVCVCVPIYLPIYLCLSVRTHVSKIV